MTPHINYSVFHFAKNYYISCGFKYIEVPWIVHSDFTKITIPKGFNQNYGKNIVASGEQSFLYLAKIGAIGPGRYSTITPCYREDDNKTPLHYEQFVKLELIEFLGRKPPSEIGTFSFSENYKEEKKKLQEIIKYCFDFFANCAGEKLKSKLTIVEEPDAPRENCNTIINYDINYNGIELGSYGIREEESIAWIYATGLALPRFNEALNANIP